MTRFNIVHVALDPPTLLETNLVKQVAAGLNKDVYETRLLLSGKIPKIVAHYDAEEAAEFAVKTLSSLGLVAFTVDDSELHKIATSTGEFIAHSLRVGEKEVSFLARNGATKTINSKDIFMILYGKMRVPITTQETRTTMKLSVPATLITGGIPIWRKSEGSVKGTSFQTEYFVWLYDRFSPEPKIEVFESNFDYGSLGMKIMPSSSKNLEMLVIEIKEKFPEAILDSRLTEYTPAMQEDEIGTVCRLICLCHRARSGISR
ncbi:MAG TPA: hypothetical protein VGA85_03125 [Dehalococcoidales bacterium]